MLTRRHIRELLVGAGYMAAAPTLTQTNGTVHSGAIGDAPADDVIE